MLNALKTDADLVTALIIDPQEKLVPHIAEAEPMLGAMDRLIRGAALFEIPIMATTQYVAGLGPIHESLVGPLEEAGVTPIEKQTFSACADDTIKARVIEIDRPQVLVSGIEAHVCVFQTVLDLMAMGHTVFVCADAVGSRRPLDRDLGLERMRQAGAIVTTVEAVLFEMCHISGTDRFKQLLKIVK
jgi:nicotinamidase-related amidase